MPENIDHFVQKIECFSGIPGKQQYGVSLHYMGLILKPVRSVSSDFLYYTRLTALITCPILEVGVLSPGKRALLPNKLCLFKICFKHVMIT